MAPPRRLRRRLRPLEVVEDYELTILDELDLQREGANTSQLRRNFAESELLYVPEVYWDYTRRTVLSPSFNSTVAIPYL